MNNHSGKWVWSEGGTKGFITCLLFRRGKWIACERERKLAIKVHNMFS